MAQNVQSRGTFKVHFRKQCNPGPYLDGDKVKKLPDYIKEKSVWITIQALVKAIIECSLETHRKELKEKLAVIDTSNKYCDRFSRGRSVLVVLKQHLQSCNNFIGMRSPKHQDCRKCRQIDKGNCVTANNQECTTLKQRVKTENKDDSALPAKMHKPIVCKDLIVVIPRLPPEVVQKYIKKTTPTKKEAYLYGQKVTVILPESKYLKTPEKVLFEGIKPVPSISEVIDEETDNLLNQNQTTQGDHDVFSPINVNQDAENFLEDYDNSQQVLMNDDVSIAAESVSDDPLTILFENNKQDTSTMSSEAAGDDEFAENANECERTLMGFSPKTIFEDIDIDQFAEDIKDTVRSSDTRSDSQVNTATTATPDLSCIENRRISPGSDKSPNQVDTIKDMPRSERSAEIFIENVVSNSDVLLESTKNNATCTSTVSSYCSSTTPGPKSSASLIESVIRCTSQSAQCTTSCYTVGNDSAPVATQVSYPFTSNTSTGRENASQTSFAGPPSTTLLGHIVRNQAPTTRFPFPSIQPLHGVLPLGFAWHDNPAQPRSPVLHSHSFNSPGYHQTKQNFGFQRQRFQPYPQRQVMLPQSLLQTPGYVYNPSTGVPRSPQYIQQNMVNAPQRAPFQAQQHRLGIGNGNGLSQAQSTNTSTNGTTHVTHAQRNLYRLSHWPNSVSNGHKQSQNRYLLMNNAVQIDRTQARFPSYYPMPKELGSRVVWYPPNTVICNTSTQPEAAIYHQVSYALNNHASNNPMPSYASVTGGLGQIPNASRPVNVVIPQQTGVVSNCSSVLSNVVVSHRSDSWQNSSKLKSSKATVSKQSTSSIADFGMRTLSGVDSMASVKNSPYVSPCMNSMLTPSKEVQTPVNPFLDSERLSSNTHFSKKSQSNKVNTSVSPLLVLSADPSKPAESAATLSSSNAVESPQVSRAAIYIKQEPSSPLQENKSQETKTSSLSTEIYVSKELSACEQVLRKENDTSVIKEPYSPNEVTRPKQIVSATKCSSVTSENSSQIAVTGQEQGTLRLPNTIRKEMSTQLQTDMVALPSIKNKKELSSELQTVRNEGKTTQPASTILKESSQLQVIGKDQCPKIQKEIDGQEKMAAPPSTTIAKETMLSPITSEQVSSRGEVTTSLSKELPSEAATSISESISTPDKSFAVDRRTTSHSSYENDVLSEAVHGSMQEVGAKSSESTNDVLLHKLKARIEKIRNSLSQPKQGVKQPVDLPVSPSPPSIIPPRQAENHTTLSMAIPEKVITCRSFAVHTSFWPSSLAMSKEKPNNQSIKSKEQVYSASINTLENPHALLLQDGIKRCDKHPTTHKARNDSSSKLTNHDMVHKREQQHTPHDARYGEKSTKSDSLKKMADDQPPKLKDTLHESPSKCNFSKLDRNHDSSHHTPTIHHTLKSGMSHDQQQIALEMERTQKSWESNECETILPETQRNEDTYSTEGAKSRSSTLEVLISVLEECEPERTERVKRILLCLLRKLKTKSNIDNSEIVSLREAVGPRVQIGEAFKKLLLCLEALSNENSKNVVQAVNSKRNAEQGITTASPTQFLTNTSNTEDYIPPKRLRLDKNCLKESLECSRAARITGEREKQHILDEDYGPRTCSNDDTVDKNCEALTSDLRSAPTVQETHTVANKLDGYVDDTRLDIATTNYDSRDMQHISTIQKTPISNENPCGTFTVTTDSNGLSALSNQDIVESASMPSTTEKASSRSCEKENTGSSFGAPTTQGISVTSSSSDQLIYSNEKPLSTTETNDVVKQEDVSATIEISSSTTQGCPNGFNIPFYKSFINKLKEISKEEQRQLNGMLKEILQKLRLKGSIDVSDLVKLRCATAKDFRNTEEFKKLIAIFKESINENSSTKVEEIDLTRDEGSTDISVDSLEDVKPQITPESASNNVSLSELLSNVHDSVTLDTPSDVDSTNDYCVDRSPAETSTTAAYATSETITASEKPFISNTVTRSTVENSQSASEQYFTGLPQTSSTEIVSKAAILVSNEFNQPVELQSTINNDANLPQSKQSSTGSEVTFPLCNMLTQNQSTVNSNIMAQASVTASNLPMLSRNDNVTLQSSTDTLVQSMVKNIYNVASQWPIATLNQFMVNNSSTVTSRSSIPAANQLLVNDNHVITQSSMATRNETIASSVAVSSSNIITQTIQSSPVIGSQTTIAMANRYARIQSTVGQSPIYSNCHYMTQSSETPGRATLNCTTSDPPSMPSFCCNSTGATHLPKPVVKFAMVNGVAVLIWDLPDRKYMNSIDKYEIYCLQLSSNEMITQDIVSSQVWSPLGVVKSLPPPMAITLTYLLDGFKSYIIVRAIDFNGNTGPFSTLCEIKV